MIASFSSLWYNGRTVPHQMTERRRAGSSRTQGDRLGNDSREDGKEVES
jgi:hypothetical protein